MTDATDRPNAVLLTESFALLDFAPKGSWLDHDRTAPLPFAVWSPEGDILGAGMTAVEAIEDARATVEAWARNQNS